MGSTHFYDLMIDKITDARLLFNFIKKEVSNYYDEKEAGSISYLLLEKFFNLGKTDVIVKKPITSENLSQSYFTEIFKRVKAMEPAQYITGIAHFYGRQFIVNSSVLIPRPETEELVDLIVRENTQKGLKILDIGTGSGCIAINLERELSSPQVYGLDINADVVAIAEQNAVKNNAAVTFIQNDILKEIPTENDFDIIVSNPPYVRKKESKLMKKNVLNFEPHIALFVPDKDPLLFYKRIITLAKDLLKNKGKLYFEINEAYGEELKEYMITRNFTEVAIFQDFQGKERMVRGEFIL